MAEGWVVGAQEAKHDAGEQQAGGVPMQLERLNWKVIMPIIRPTIKKAQKASRSVTWL
ncbi:hypothetical protein MJ579_10050 [Klebsiella pneumoniae]|nr:hypothetical protein MJ579_10050 [Klebsiella pneumoniae]